MKEAGEVQKLRTQLQDEKKKSHQLSEELERPEGSMRKWRQLPGTDPDPETLQSKIAFLEERLNVGLNLILSAEVDHVNKNHKFGFGMTVGE